MSDLTLNEALTIIGGFSNTDKMPWLSWSVSAFDCQVGSKLREIPGSTCSNCYALKFRYTFPAVQGAQRKRMAALDDPRFEAAFIFALDFHHQRTRRTRLVNGETIRENRFRLYDSGDLQSLDNLEMWNRIALALPKIEMWLPTREVEYVRQFKAVHSEGFAKNLIVRISTPMQGDRFRNRPMGLPFSTVDRTDPDIKACPASNQGNKCLDCSTCWSQANVSYASH